MENRKSNDRFLREGRKWDERHGDQVRMLYKKGHGERSEENVSKEQNVSTERDNVENNVTRTVADRVEENMSEGSDINAERSNGEEKNQNTSTSGYVLGSEGGQGGGNVMEDCSEDENGNVVEEGSEGGEDGGNVMEEGSEGQVGANVMAQGLEGEVGGNVMGEGSEGGQDCGNVMAGGSTSSTHGTQYKCRFCGNRFFSFKGYMTHIWHAHP